MHDKDAVRHSTELDHLMVKGYFLMPDGSKSSEHKQKLKKRQKKGGKAAKAEELKKTKKAKKDEWIPNIWIMFAVYV